MSEAEEKGRQGVYVYANLIDANNPKIESVNIKKRKQIIKYIKNVDRRKGK